LFGLSLLSFCLLCFFVDLKKSRKEQERFLAKEKAAKERRASVISGQGIEGDSAHERFSEPDIARKI
jgi:hypothetical protein